MDFELLVLDLTASRAEVGRALEAVEAFGERLCLPEGLSHDVRLAVDETLANVVLHGYGEDGLSPIQLTAHVEGGFLVIEIIDHAPPFDPASVPTKEMDESTGEPEIGGLGIGLLYSVAEEVLYRRENDRNHLILSWKMPPC